MKAKEWLKANKLCCQDLADVTKIPRGTLWRIVYKDQDPKLWQAMMIVHFTDREVTFRDLLGEIGREKTKEVV